MGAVSGYLAPQFVLFDDLLQEVSEQQGIIRRKLVLDRVIFDPDTVPEDLESLKHTLEQLHNIRAKVKVLTEPALVNENLAAEVDYVKLKAIAIGRTLLEKVYENRGKGEGKISTLKEEYQDVFSYPSALLARKLEETLTACVEAERCDEVLTLDILTQELAQLLKAFNKKTTTMLVRLPRFIECLLRDLQTLRLRSDVLPETEKTQLGEKILTAQKEIVEYAKREVEWACKTVLKRNLHEYGISFEQIEA